MTKKNVTKKSKAVVASKTAESKRADSKKGDLIEMILKDHKSLKDLTKILKDKEQSMNDRWEAFQEFAPRLLEHAIPEEKVLYKFLKTQKDLREEGFEGEAEHILADQMIEEAKRARDDDRLSAQMKILAELVENHIDKEEKNILPDFRKHCEAADRVEMGERFLRLKQRVQQAGSDDAPSENRRTEYREMRY